jgi:glyoxylase-like metal-dependent hydrolase (beta-lactamase superfamily II)
MLRLQEFVYNAFAENTYLIINEKNECWIVDPGMNNNQERTQFTNYIAREKLTPMGIINTHAHIDHILGVQAMIDIYKIPFGMHEKDMPVMAGAKGSAILFGFDLPVVPEPTYYISEHEPLKLGDDVLEVRFTPGHSPGSIVFYSAQDGWLIGGDVLFAGGIGRTDLPGGNHQTLLDSINSQLFSLPDEVRVYPGHGPSTTIGYEKKANPFL